eukprot:jgi/Chlat1/8613/Chrsp86S08004
MSPCISARVIAILLQSTSQHAPPPFSMKAGFCTDLYNVCGETTYRVVSNTFLHADVSNDVCVKPSTRQLAAVQHCLGRHCDLMQRPSFQLELLRPAPYPPLPEHKHQAWFQSEQGILRIGAMRLCRYQAGVGSLRGHLLSLSVHQA